MRAVLLLGGNLHPGPALNRAVAGAGLVIAADGGIRHAAPLGLSPDLWVGDFDSSTPELFDRYPRVPRETHPRDKDATDAELAAWSALRAGARELLLVGAVGDELDHTLGHLALALALVEGGIQVVLTDGRTWAWPLVPPGLTLDLPEGTPFSLVPWTPLRGLAISGARWELAATDLAMGSTRTLRNRNTGRLTLKLSSGRGIVVATPPFPSRFHPFPTRPRPPALS